MNTNERTSRIENPTKKAAIAAVVIAIGLLAIVLLAFSCASSDPAGNAGTADTPHSAHSKDAAGSSEIEQGNAIPESDNGIEEDASNSYTAIEQTVSVQDLQQGTEKADSLSQATAPGRTAPSNDSAPAQPQKAWVEDTERVWVVDKEAWTESVPVYGTVEVSICNICGTDITGNTSAHAKEHMKVGEGSGHHSETRQKITGYDTVNHLEEGHWETRVVDGHWK